MPKVVCIFLPLPLVPGHNFCYDIYYIILWGVFLNRSTINNFVIEKDLLFQSASRHINRNKIHCKCCIHQGLVICMLNRPFWPSAIGYIPST